jgi:hypothetical protein
MYSLNNIIKYNKYKVAHQIRLVHPETSLAQITRSYGNECFSLGFIIKQVEFFC